jgi:hypothetical protein
MSSLAGRCKRSGLNDNDTSDPDLWLPNGWPKIRVHVVNWLAFIAI